MSTLRHVKEPIKACAPLLNIIHILLHTQPETLKKINEMMLSLGYQKTNMSRTKNILVKEIANPLVRRTDYR